MIARTIVSIASVQNRYSVTDRGSEDVLDYCEQTTSSSSLGFPWQRVNLPARIVSFVVWHRKRTRRLSQVALHGFWRESPVILPIPGTSKVAHLVENVAAAGVGLTEDEINTLNQILLLDL